MDKVARLPRRAVVTSNELLCPSGTFKLSFQVSDGEPFEFEPGQFVSIDCEHPELGYRRSPYCILTPPCEARTFDLLVRRIPTGPVSIYLSELEPEDRVSFSGPAGASMVPKSRDRDFVLMATGVGISPFCSLIPQLLESSFDRKVSLYWGLRRAEDICLTDELDVLVAENASFEYFISLSRASERWNGLRGRLTETLPPRLTSLQKTEFYLSGNGAMIAEMSEALAAVGVSQTHVFEEYFFNVRYRPRWQDVETIASRFVAKDAQNLFAELTRLKSDRASS